MSSFAPSPQQEKIFNWFKSGSGNAIIRARAGCGKTTTILAAIEYAPENKILLAAFNKDIANELKERLKNPRAQARTLHSLGNFYVWKKWGNVTVDPKRGVNLAYKAMKTNDTKRRDEAHLIAKLASVAKNIMAHPTVDNLVDLAFEYSVLPEADEKDFETEVRKLAEHAHKAIELATVRDGSIDYDDMIFLPVRCNWIFPFYNMVVVDEAQDMNPNQLALAQGACRRDGRIAVVGDNCQAIYAFRGADSQALDNLKTTLKAVEFGLTTTYRCPQLVVQMAKRIVPDFNAAPTAPEGIVDHKAIKDMYSLVSPGNFVLSRTNAPLASICLHLLRDGHRAFIRGRDIGASLRTLVKNTNTITIPELAEAMEMWKIRMTDKLTAEDADDSAFQRVEDQVATISALSEGLASVKELFARIDEIFSDNGTRDAVVCSTIHRAKGLESEHVFLLQKTLRRGRNDEDSNTEEEKNIEYVGITRAKNHLTLIVDLP